MNIKFKKSAEILADYVHLQILIKTYRVINQFVDAISFLGRFNRKASFPSPKVDYFFIIQK